MSPRITFEALTQNGGLVSREPVEKTIKWKGQEFTVGIRILGAGEAEEIFRPNEKQKSLQCRLIAATVVLGEGDEATPLTYDQAYRLDPVLGKALVDAVNEAQDTGNA